MLMVMVMVLLSVGDVVGDLVVYCCCLLFVDVVVDALVCCL